jgi:exodeoxyribonuclease III
VRVVSWNLNSLKARLPRVLELLDVHAPDVLLVQETKLAADAWPREELAMAGYRIVDHSEGRWNGVAILAPQDVEVDDVVAGLPGEPNEAEARWIEGTVRGVRFVSVYVVNGREPDHPMFQQKLDFLDAAHDRLEELVAAGPVVVAGDWNVAPSDHDVWDPSLFVGSTHVTPDERVRFAGLLELGLVDAWHDVHGDEVGFTYWDYRAGAFRRNMGMRIDAALVSHHLEVRDCAVDTVFRRNNQAGDKPSDHAPLVVTIDLGA